MDTRRAPGHRAPHGNKRFHRHGHGGGGGRHGNGGGAHPSAARGSFWFKGEGYNDYEAVSIDEDVVGIHGFLNGDAQGFPGLVKQRYADFIVHEITANGQQAALTTLIKRKRGVQNQFIELVTAYAFEATSTESTTETEEPSDATRQVHKFIRDVAQRLGRQASANGKHAQEVMEQRNHGKLVAHITSELGEKMGGEFAEFLQKVKARKLQDADAKANGTATAEGEHDENDLVFYVGGLNEKHERVFLHETMRRYGQGLITADTITAADNRQVIRVRRTTSGPVRKGERDPRREWPVDRPDYLQFVIYKRNKDLVAIVNQIASVLKTNPSFFTYADAKEKRGITSQLCTVYRVSKERFQNFSRHMERNLDDQHYLVGNLKYVSKKLSSSDCLGNHFSIALRAIPDETQLPTAKLVDLVRQWETRGFINFFGIHRFGNSSTPSHLIGRAVLRKDFKLAVLLLLRPQDGEASKIREAREHFRQHKDVAAALRMFPPFLIPERAVLEGLLQHGMEANEIAFRNIAAHLRTAYVESYQHYVWNQMASLRIRDHSTTQPIVGDLVYEVEVSKNEANQPKRRVIALTTENMDKYTIDDVLLPIPGYDVQYPENAIGEAYRKMLSMDGVDFASWRTMTMSANHNPFQLQGSYRHVVKHAQHVTHEIKTYTDSTQALILNDVDRLLGRTAPICEGRRGQPKDSEANAATEAVKEPAKPERALVLHFRLDHGSDGTIAVRELLKQSSSIHVQWQLRDQKDGTSVGNTASSAVVPDRTRPAGKTGGEASKKRASTTALAGNRTKDAKVAAPKKSQVAIGRPGFSLGKC
ncbi:hypothetical protein Poli38472_000316 [Pythium oligandrum]|uniref:TRUD domain-containing protein n=1 Tax=Pythium oligandrum TaxID=41045 RepID=A0A8K1CC23_PYTOL|nr:hypothetical protein Poli38472_000316 [Pythium oligandrum]|eukprot:TMW60274.1 hypothetical protein Poli38472_000316 [Pythium oligandrum]